MNEQAKFRGASFFCESGDASGGRVLAIHEYPFSENPAYTEDTGKRSRRFTVEAYVLGPKYVAERDALIAELEKAGPGELLHPNFGPRRVAVAGFKVREERSKKRIVYFTIDFVETLAGAPAPLSTVDAPTALAASVASAQTSVGDQFMASYSKVLAFKDKVSTALRNATREMDKVLNVVTLEVQSNAKLRRQIGILRSDAFAIAGSPERVLASVGGLFTELQTSIAAVANADPSAALLSLFNFDPGERPTGLTASRLVELQAFDATVALVKRQALIAAAASAITQTFPTYNDAVDRRNLIANLIDTHLEVAADDIDPAMFDLRAALVLAVPGSDSDLPRLQPLTLSATTPSLVLAHRLYGSVALEADLVARNRVSNPGFVPGGVPLQVLTYA